MIHWQALTIRNSRAAIFALLVGLPVLIVAARVALPAYFGAPVTAQTASAGRNASTGPVVGAAILPATGGDVAQTAGATGTIDISKLVVPANAVLAPDLDGTVRPAQPFSMNGASAIDRARALDCLSTAIYYEAASESDDGERAVAQVILNRVRHPAFPNTVCGVVYQGSDRGTGCQFSYACDGSMARPRSAAGIARATRIAAAALNGYVMGAVGMATHYHTYAVTPSWNRSLVMTDAIGAHFFHRWKGYWGTPAAFTNARYHGGEPVPGPYRRADPAPSAMPALTLAMATLIPAPSAIAPERPAAVPAPKTNVDAIQAQYRDASVAKTDSLPGDSQILDRWKDSGKPLR